MATMDASDRDRLREIENREWRDSLDYVLREQGSERVRELLRHLQSRAQEQGVSIPFTANTPYINTIPRAQQPVFPGNREIERRIKSIIRWNAMAMVVRANKELPGIGGHISTFASAAALWEVGFNHFWRGRTDDYLGDMVYFQGHAAPGVYARAFLEGRIDEKHLVNFRRELAPEGGLSSYPHPFLMRDFWEFPTVSMGLTALQAIYMARYNHYLVDRDLRRRTGRKVWALLGDGEMDEPESLGAITLAAREQLGNLIFVINCNLQRLDGPVRGNGKVIQELEAAFRGAGWFVIKVIWGGDWDRLLERDKSGKLLQRMEEILDGEMQRYTVSDGAYIREHFFGTDPELLALVQDYTDEQIRKMVRGGHDPEKVYAAYKLATSHGRPMPTVILAQTIKGYGLGEAGEGKNITHSQKKLNEDELREFRTRFNIPISDEDIAAMPFYRPTDDSPEMQYLHKRREELGGSLPKRVVVTEPIACQTEHIFQEYLQGSGDRDVATTMSMVHMIAQMLRDPEFGKFIVPIVPDEARTFGLESLFRQVGIYSHVGQLYEPVDRGSLLFYNEKKTGAVLEEGISEAGAMASFIAAGTAYANNRVNTIPFFLFYSMFGFQRIGDLIWAACDMQAKGFLIGATAGRTTLSGEGLQHQDGHSHVLALAPTTVKAYDPAFAYELATIVHDGITRMYCHGETWIYYLTVMNETYKQPARPEGSREGILKGMYRFRPGSVKATKTTPRAHLLGSGAILNETLAAQTILEERYGVSADVWSVTSYKELYREAIEAERFHMLNPGQRQRPYVETLLAKERGVFVAASDYMKVLPASIARWLPGPLHVLGTDGFGRSDGRAQLRDFFEVDRRYIALAALHELARVDQLDMKVAQKAVKELDIDPGKLNPHVD